MLPPRHDSPRATTRAAAAFVFFGLLALILVLPHGEMAPRGQGARWMRTLGSVAGQISMIVLLGSLALARDWPLVRHLKPARRVRLHAGIGKMVLALALVHTLLLVARLDLRGWLPGTLALVAFVVHGLANVLRARLVRAWGPGWWRYAHRASAWAALLLSVEHVLMASWHWGLARHFELTGWGH